MADCCDGCRPKASGTGSPAPVLAIPGVLRLDEAARLWLGVPFLHQGRTQWGLDCVGLIVFAARECGINLRDVTAYGRDPSHGTLDRHLLEQLGMPVPDLAPGRVVSITWSGASRHVGIVGQDSNGLTLIHTSSGVGRVVEHGLRGKWPARITAIYSLENR